MEAQALSSVPQSILIIDDDPVVYDCFRRYLKDEPLELTWCQGSEQAMFAMAEKDYDVFVIDFMIDNLNGVDLFVKMKPHLSQKNNLPKPAILLTGYEDQKIAIQAMHAGFTDMLQKDHLSSVMVKRTIDNAYQKYQLQLETERHKLALQEMNQVLKAKNDEIRLFYQTVSHELKTPLTSVIEYLNLIQDGYSGELTDEMREFLSIMDYNCQLLKLFISDLLDAGRLETNKFSINKKNTVIKSVIDRVIASQIHAAEKKNIQVYFYPDCPDLTAMVDEDRLFQVVANLLNNAIKFSYKGGVIKIYLNQNTDTTFIISVKDNGCGISQRHQQQVFQRLFQVKQDEFYHERGLGLGLSICKEIIEKHHGKIWLESQVGNGSFFYVQLPIHSL